MANLYTLLKSDVKQIRKIITKELKDNGYEPIVADKYIYAKGDIPVLLVAHYDTVFSKPPKYITNKDGVLSSKKGLGADDRAGVYGVLTLCKDYHCHVLFVDEEEKGCKGSKAFVKDFKEMDINYMIELDRRGVNDAVYYDGDNKDFETFITTFGWTTALGSCTDICTLAPHFGVMGVNLSIGYQNEHHKEETLDTSVMNQTIERVKSMLNGDKFEWKEREYSRWTYGYGYNDTHWYSGDYPDYNDILDLNTMSFEIYYTDLGDDECVDVEYGISFEEAIGNFLIDNPELTFGNIIDVVDEYGDSFIGWERENAI